MDVQRRWRSGSWFVAAALIVVIGVGLTILAVVQSSKSSNTSTSTSTSTSTATTSAPSTSAQASGPNETIADYIKNNNIQETTITPGTPGAPTIDLPVPEGWTRIPEGADAQYFGIVFNTPTNPDDPPKIIATVEKLTGNVDTDKLLAVAPGEVKNLPGYNGGDGQKGHTEWPSRIQTRRLVHQERRAREWLPRTRWSSKARMASTYCSSRPRVRRPTPTR